MSVESVNQEIEAYVLERLQPLIDTNNGLLQQLASVAEDKAQLEMIVADLKRQLDALGPKPSTLMGVTVTGAVRNQYPDLHQHVEISRVKTGIAKNWESDLHHKVFPNAKWACSSSQNLSLQELDALLATIPPSDKEQIVAWCDTEEPEHPENQLFAGDFKKRMQESSKIIRSHGLKVASCVMGFSVPNDTWLAWIDVEAVDILAFNKCNAGAKKTPPYYMEVEALIDNLAWQTQRFGKPWALWETGTDQFGDEASRIAWALDLRKAIEDAGGLHAIWSDRVSRNPRSPWTALLQPQAAAEAWLM